MALHLLWEKERKSKAKASSSAQVATSPALSPTKKFLLQIGALVLSVAFGVSLVGLVVLMDVEEKKLSITNSAFGEFWLKYNRGNPVLQPALFNFSTIGLFMVYRAFYPTPTTKPKSN